MNLKIEQKILGCNNLQFPTYQQLNFLDQPNSFIKINQPIPKSIAIISLNDDKTKELLTEVMVELIKSNRDVLREIMVDALEEVGLTNAIAEGRNNDFVSEAEIFSILSGEASADKI
ncbi:hypothetical protein [Methylosoma difficile]